MKAIQEVIGLVIWKLVVTTSLLFAHLAHAENAVVFDIDGTLTPDVWKTELVRDGAVAAVQLYANKGFKIIYLSTRYKLFQFSIPYWLARNKFPNGDVHVPLTKQDRQLPYEQYKAHVLRNYQGRGWNIAYAYGDSSTDFAAYEAVGIPPDRVYGLLREHDTQCQTGRMRECLAGWGPHLRQIERHLP